MVNDMDTDEDVEASLSIRLPLSNTCTDGHIGIRRFRI